MNASFARYTGAPSRTSTGPPPIASATVRPVRLEDEPQRHRRADCASACSFAAALPRATSTAVPGAIRTEEPVCETLRHGTDEVGVRCRRRKGAEHDGERARDARRRRAPVGREERDPVRSRAPCSGSSARVAARVPRQVPRNLTRRTSSSAVERDPRARARRVRRGGEHTVAKEDPARLARRPRRRSRR